MEQKPRDTQRASYYDVEEEDVQHLEALQIGASSQAPRPEPGPWGTNPSRIQGGPIQQGQFQQTTPGLPPGTNINPDQANIANYIDPAFAYAEVQETQGLQWSILGNDFLYDELPSASQHPGAHVTSQTLSPFASSSTYHGGGLRGSGLGPVLPDMQSNTIPSQLPGNAPWQEGSGEMLDSAWPFDLQAQTHAHQPNPWHEPEGPEDESASLPASLPTSHNTSHEGSATEQASLSRKAKGKRPRRARAGAFGGQGGHLHSFKVEAPASPGPDAMSRTSVGSLASQSTFPSAASSSSAQLPSRLRSASRTSKNIRHKPAESPEERRSRASHNFVEKQYRNRLNAEFENLLNAIPDQGRALLEEDERQKARRPSHENREFALDMSDRRVSKADVLDLARRQIKALEKERDDLEKERDDLRTTMENLCRQYGIPDPFPEKPGSGDAPEESPQDAEE